MVEKVDVTTKGNEVQIVDQTVEPLEVSVDKVLAPTLREVAKIDSAGRDGTKVQSGLEEGEWLVPPSRKTAKGAHASRSLSTTELALKNSHASIDPG